MRDQFISPLMNHRPQEPYGNRSTGIPLTDRDQVPLSTIVGAGLHEQFPIFSTDSSPGDHWSRTFPGFRYGCLSPATCLGKREGVPGSLNDLEHLGAPQISLENSVDLVADTGITLLSGFTISEPHDPDGNFLEFRPRFQKHFGFLIVRTCNKRQNEQKNKYNQMSGIFHHQFGLILNLC